MRLFARTLVALLVCTGMVPGVSAYLGEDPGFDLYRTVDRSSGLLESRLMQKYLRGSGSKANELIGKICRNDG